MKNLTKKSILKLKPSSTLVINEKSKELIEKGKKVYKFGFGQSPFPVPEKIVSALKDNAHRKEYLPIQGLGRLRESISKNLKKKTGIFYPKDNIVITPGSKEAMLLLHVAFNGEIILSAPSWVSYEPQAIIGRNKVHWIQTTRENNWFPTSIQLEKKIKSIKKKNLLFIINSPNNPSGTICKNLKELALVAKKYNLLVLSDEIYTDLTFCNKYESISQYYPQGTFISGGLSKWCGAGGWRVGFFAVPNKLSKLLENIKTLASESYSTVNSPAQYAAVEAYEGNYSEYKSKTINILRSVGNYVYTNLRSNKVLVNPPQGAFYLMPEFPNKKYRNSKELCKVILNETGVAMLPASDFGFNPKKMLTRLCYIDFNGEKFLKETINLKTIDDRIIEKYAPNVVEGIKKLSNWAQNL
ncbi:MAG: aminotransferase class I/II-fold pyridoxal phosphate-dependent enzyme [Candidatus Pelagibacter sp. TMED263]|nr:MAG: aminotransferase class I/II-fold pyridoxal phosphate-dependent enzyme [Candidatus Pelagibacter sp. TMED263]|tara:strand:- start:228 stop:1463 length:1236 start_codon:yes stop_codon:yes gene_type:complete